MDPLCCGLGLHRAWPGDAGWNHKVWRERVSVPCPKYLVMVNDATEEGLVRTCGGCTCFSVGASMFMARFEAWAQRRAALAASTAGPFWVSACALRFLERRGKRRPNR